MSGDSKMDISEQEDGESLDSSSLRRKRLRKTSPDTPSVTALSLDESAQHTMPSIQSLSLEAIFHPKFENESRHDQTIRQQMKERISAEKGFIEVSLKHSGSLLLWSGGQRYYSKNSTENQFTLVGELLLRQHMFRAWHELTTDSKEEMYMKCCDFVQENRLTLAFEVVTAILGHHGDIPRRDFLILTAVADRSTEQFYSTCQLIDFAQRFRLPHNDTWVVASESGVQGLFHLYDTTRETGLADDTIAALSRVADLHVSSMYPHTVFQGNILEGIVIRFVPYHDKAAEQKLLRSLAEESDCILKHVPPERPPSFVLAKSLSNGSTLPAVLTTNIREISCDVMATGDRKTVSSFLEASVRNSLCSSDGGERRGVDRNPSQVGKEWAKNFPKALKETLAGQDLDKETRRILKLVETLANLKSQVDYRIAKESTEGQQDRWLCIVHVFYDATHQKFRRKMDPDDMSLFRGFCIELGADRKDTPIHDDTSTRKELLYQNGEDSGLMLKMKFLPYMVRTFGCRNGLQVISQRGPQAFANYTMKLMKMWGISSEATAKWQPFFRAWGKYAQWCLSGQTNKYTNTSMPMLGDTFYLEHLEHFTKLYDSGQFVDEDQSTLTSTFRGLVFVVGLTQEKADLAADTISERLGGVCRRRGVSAIAPKDWNSVCLLRERGMICSTTVDDRIKQVRRQLVDCGEGMFGVLAGCDKTAVALLVTKGAKNEESPTSTKSAETPLTIESVEDGGVPANENDSQTPVDSRELEGKIQSWRATRFAKVFEVSDSELFDASVVDKEMENALHCNGAAIQSLTAQLSSASYALPQQDDRPGLLLFFPGIPGSGKSTLCSPAMEVELRRKVEEMEELELNGKGDSGFSPTRALIIRTGDNVKKKYWPLVKVDKAKNPASVYIADKNSPPSAWSAVGQVCALSNGVAVPILPDDNALHTTQVEGAKHYPFSLHYLAVCMSRVMARPASSHAGNLDSCTDLACMVVVKFFGLYRGMCANELLSSIQRALEREKAMISFAPIRVPFFAQTHVPDLPSELVDALHDAIRIQYEDDMALDTKVRAKEERAQKIEKQVTAKDEKAQKIEKRLREVIMKYNDFLVSLSPDPAISKREFVSQVMERVAALATPRASQDGTSGDGSDFIKIVSVDVSQELVHKLLRNFAKTHPRLSKFLEQLFESDDDAVTLPTSIDGVFPGEHFVADTHVTMVHFSELKQSAMRDHFETLIGCTVNVTITGILWNKRIAALSVEVATETAVKPDREIPAPKNSFPHITIWHQKDASARESNDLPGLVESGGAERIDFCEPAVIQGSISFWGPDQG